jgi:hypothetical protein
MKNLHVEIKSRIAKAKAASKKQKNVPAADSTNI